MATPAFCPSPRELTLDRLVVSSAGITVVAMARRSAVACPLCGFLSRRVHSRDKGVLTKSPGGPLVEMLKGEGPTALERRHTSAEAIEHRSFAAGIWRNRHTVRSVVLFAWSLGQLGGQVNRTRLFKRTRYGCASFALPRLRALRVGCVL